VNYSPPLGANRFPLPFDNPALAREDWLPETEWDGLEALRETHIRLLSTRDELAEELAALERADDSAERQRTDALEAAYRDGTEPDQAAPQSKPEEREAEIAAARERLEAANAALDSFLRDAVSEIESRCDEFLSDLAQMDVAAKAKLEEAKRMTAEAQANVSEHQKLRLWLGRTAGRHPMFKTGAARHFPYAQMGTPLPEDEVDPRLRGVVHG
jgi:chemotaxis protein histidine kinase CheA